MQPTVRDEPFTGLDTATLYAIVRLRADVLVVEQRCAYRDLDGRDTDPSTRHIWCEEGEGPVAYLRVVHEHDGRVRIGRVVSAPEARGRGLASRLVEHALARPHDGRRAVVLDAQSRLVGWYGGFGFEVTGEEYLLDGIAHVPMRLARAEASNEATSASEV